MAIAIACNGLQIAPVFVACSSYTCYDVSTGSPARGRNIPASDQPLSRLPDFFSSIGADTLICGEMDPKLEADLKAAGIEVVSGVFGDPLSAVEDYLNE